MPKSFQTINYQYPKPANFDAADSAFDMFKNIADEKCAPPEIEFLKNVRISSNSVVFNYFKIFKESCIKDENYEKYSKGFRFFFKFIFPKFNCSKKRFLLITDEWTSNYYHWHLFALKKLLILKEQNLIENTLLFLPKKYQGYKFVFPSLAKFGIKENQIVFLRQKSNIKVAELPLITASRQHPEMFRELRKILTETATKTGLDFGDKIYISREGQVLRFVENEKEVTALLEKYGFKKIIAEKFSYDEQLEIFAKTKYLVGPHGAGLTNVLFMPENSSFLEITTPQTPSSFNRDYYALSSMVGIKYFYQQAQIGPRSPVKDFHQGSLVIDLEKLEKNLRLMLNE